MFAEIIAQIEELGKAHTMLYGYGPLGVICLFFMYRDVARDRLIRESISAVVAATNKNAHRIQGLSMALLYNAATHAPERIRELAAEELDRQKASQAADEALAKK